MFKKKGDGVALAKLRSAPEQYRGIAERLHEIVRESAPTLEPVVRWGLVFYVKDGVDVCYIKPDKDFIAFGFNEVINPARQEGEDLHPVAWTLSGLNAGTESRIRELLSRLAV